MTGEDGKKFKTRSGETVKLSDLLMEAVRIAGESIRKRRKEEGGEGYQASFFLEAFYLVSYFFTAVSRKKRSANLLYYTGVRDIYQVRY